jgi:hypothetical protein
MKKKKLEVVPAHNDRTHARVPPSGMKTLVICPSHTGEERDPNAPPSAADEGTMMHEAFESGMLLNLNPEQAAAVQECLDYVKKYTDAAEKGHVHRELKLEIMGLTFGTSDLIVWHAHTKTLHVFDVKFGRNPVEDAEINKQGWCYVEGAWSKYPDAEEVHMHFIQPRCDQLSIHVFKPADRQKIQLFIKMAVARVSQPAKKRERVFDPHNCFYCGQLGTCSAPAVFGYGIVRRYAPDKLGNVKLDFATDPALIIDGETAGKTQLIADIMGKWASAVKDQNKQLFLGGTEVVGYKLVERGGSTSLRTGAIGEVLTRIIGKGEFKKIKLSLQQVLEQADVKLDTLLSMVAAHETDKKKNTALRGALINALEMNGLVEHGQPSHYLKRV